MSERRDDERVSVGVVGCGAVIQQCYLPVFQSLSRFRVTGVHDLNVANAEVVAAATGAAVMPFERMLSECAWLILATPPESHFDLALRAVRAGRQVVVEKPFVTSVAQAETLVAESAGGPGWVYVAQFRRAFPGTRLARDLIECGVLGRVQGLEMFEGGKFAWETKSGYVGKSRFGGVLFDTGSHVVDQALFVAGLTEGACRIGVDSVRRDKAEPSHEIQASFRIQSGSGDVAAMLRLSRAQPLANLIRVRGEEGVLELDVGFDGGVRLQRKGRNVALAARERFPTFVDAFVAEYREMLEHGRASMFGAASTLTQLRILEALHQHV